MLTFRETIKTIVVEWVFGGLEETGTTKYLEHVNLFSLIKAEEEAEDFYFDKPLS